MGLTISGISGPQCSGSPASIDLTLSLASRLTPRLHLLGSTLYSLTWRVRVTPAGRRISALRASGRRTEGKGCTGWPTPNAEHQNDGDTNWEARREAIKAQGINGNGFGLTLGMAATLSLWPTPMAGSPATETYNEAGNNDFSRKVVELASWPTANTPSGGPNSKSTPTHTGGMDLDGAATLAGWGTPNTCDYLPSYNLEERKKRGGCSNLKDQVPLTDSGEMPNGSPAPMEKRGQLNPELPRWLMAFPEGWSNYAPTETRSVLIKRRNSSKPTRKSDKC